MKTILCFGDSNTWGYDPATKERFPRDQRWTGVLRRELGDPYEIIAEGLNGRTTVWDDSIDEYRNGKKYLIPCLISHQPLDLVVVLLGTNDLKMRFSLSAIDIAKGAASLVDVIQKSGVGRAGKSPQVLLMAPPPLGKLTEFAEMFEGAEIKSQRLSRHYRQKAEECGCEFFDTAEAVASSDIDGVHWEPGEHQKLGQAVAGIARRILG